MIPARLCRLPQVSVALLALIAVPARAVTYVRADAPGPVHDGTSWQTAFTTLKAAASASGVEEVWVAAGTYPESGVSGATSIAWYGGFRGDETSREQRDWRINATVVKPTGTTGIPMLFQMAHGGVLDGFTLKGGLGGASLSGTATVQNCTVSGGAGKGISATGATVTIRDNTVTLCAGGGISLSSCSGTVSGNRIIGNWATQTAGGGLSTSNGAVLITGNLITANACYTTGGGLYCYGTPAPTITHNVITANRAGTGGGGMYVAAAEAVVTDNIVAANDSSIGAGICLFTTTTPKVTNNTVAYNTSGEGLAVNGAGTIANNIVAYNTGGISTPSLTTSALLRFNCVYGNTSYDYKGVPDQGSVNGNIKLDPRFAAGAVGNLHIRPDSPCIGKGSNSDASAGDTDIDGQARIQGVTVDIGADESDGTTWSQAPVVVRVREDGDDASDGASWASAKRTLVDAVASLGTTGGEVWAATGTYAGPVVVPAFVSLYGGFAGTETDRGQRGRDSLSTVDVGRTGSAVVLRAGNSFTTVDGFVLRNGTGFPPTWTLSDSSPDGGGIYGDATGARVSRTVLTGNSALVGGGAAFNGGAPHLSNLTVVGNIGMTGAGIAILGSRAGAQPVLRDSLVSGNMANGSGGGLYVESGSPQVVGCTFADNTAVGGGGIYAYTTGITIANTLVARNSSGIQVPGSTSAPILSHNDVFGNAAYDYGALADPTGTNGNIKVDPLFADAEQGDYHIQPLSPARDAGDTTLVAADETDMDGQARVQGAAVDIGVDESDGTLWLPSTRTVRVRPDGDDANSGASWSSAKRTLQSAVTSLSGTGGPGGEVWAAAGTYTECVTLAPYIRLLGGFSGSETTADQRDWAVHRTVVDGGQAGSVITVSATAIRCVVDGFTIRNGAANLGAGILCTAPFVAISHNVITGNTATGASALGGGLCISQSGVVKDNLFAGNAGKYGSAVFFGGAASSFTNNTVVNNTGANGAVAISQSASPTLANNIVANNSVGVYRVAGTSTPILRANDVYGNGVNMVNITDPTGTDGNTARDPRFVDAANGDYRLEATSPCVDAGVDAAVAPDEHDIQDLPRVQALHVDMGAYESAGPHVVSGPATVFVRPDGNDSSDGTSWALAKRTVVAALEAVRSPGGEVWVAAGTYPGNVVVFGGVGLYGGFAGTETLRDERDADRNVTILDGGGSGSVVIVPSTADASTVIDGFTIRNGAGTPLWSGSFMVRIGSGILCYGAPMIGRCTITGNKGTMGAAIYCGAGAAPVIEGSEIRANGPGAAAIYATGAAITLTGNTIEANAGGISADNSTGVLTGNTIRGNTGSIGGIAWTGGTLTVRNNVFAGNTAQNGGGLYASGAALDARNNVFTANVAALGAGLYLKAGTATVTNNTFVANRFQVYKPRPAGGAAYLTGAAATFANNLVAFNDSGIEADQSTPVMRSNDVFGNVYDDVSGFADPTGRDGNIKADPHIVSLVPNDVHIQPDSPCRDAGDDTAAAPGDTDMDGQPRLLFSHVDIGADESDGSLHPVTTRVVRVKATGLDTSDGSTWAAAKRTIQAAIGALGPDGGEVWVAGGSYPQPITLPSFVSVYGGFAGGETSREQRNWTAHPTTIEVTASGTPVYVPAGGILNRLDGFTLIGVVSESGVVLGAGASTVIANNTIRGAGSGINSDNALPIILHNLITGNSAGILFSSSIALVTGNTIRDNVSYGIKATGSAPLAIRNNIISGHAASGIDADQTPLLLRDNVIVANVTGVSGSSVQGTVTGNTIALNAFRGLFSTNRSVWTVSNNIVAFNGSGIEEGPNSPGSFTISSNDVFGNNGHDYVGLTNRTGSEGNISADPLFADPPHGNVHIQPSSPCRNAGDTSLVAADTGDIDGQARVMDGHVDMGADESDGTVWAPTTLVVRVSPSGNDASDGSTWATAKRTLQAAINAAVAGGEVWAAGGAYRENISVGPFCMLYGGFAGTEAGRGERNWIANPTILDGGRQTAVNMIGGTGGNGIDGFTIRNGYTTTQYGGGVYVVGGTPTIAHCTITANSGYSALALYASASSVRLVDNLIIANGPQMGFSCVVMVGPAAPYVAHNRFEGNVGDTLTFEQGCTPTVVGNVFTRNYAAQTLTLSGGSGVVKDNLVDGNLGLGPSGGGIEINASSTLVANNTIVGNYTTGLHFIGSASSPPVAVNNIVAFNGSGISVDANSPVQPVLRNNDVFGSGVNNYVALPDPTGTDGNIKLDPLFASRATGDYHLTAGSPCQDAGDDSIIAAGELDLDGTARRKGTHVDIGAYELGPAPAPTLADTAAALRILGGLMASPVAGGGWDAPYGPPPAPFGLADVVRMAQQAAGA